MAGLSAGLAGALTVFGLAPPEPGSFLIWIEASAFGPSPSVRGCVVTESGAVMSYGDPSAAPPASRTRTGYALYDDTGISDRLGSNFRPEAPLSQIDRSALAAARALVNGAAGGKDEFRRVTFDGGQVAITLSARINGRIVQTYLKGWGDQEVRNSSPDAAALLAVLNSLSSSRCRPSEGY